MPIILQPQDLVGRSRNTKSSRPDSAYKTLFQERIKVGKGVKKKQMGLRRSGS